MWSNIHVYVDEIVVKTKQHLTLLDDLKETFANLRKYKVKLNPEKCVFDVPAGKLLGFLVSERGIQSNLEKIKAIERVRKPTWLYDVQKFTGCLASVSRFLSRLRERTLPLYQQMKKISSFEWLQFLSRLGERTLPLYKQMKKISANEGR